MKSDSIIINIPTGALIDEQALLVALENKIIREVALDVFLQEHY